MSDNNYNGIGLLPLLTVLFIGLKLGEVIAWSWWWVLAPTWIPVALAIVFLLVMWMIISKINREAQTTRNWREVLKKLNATKK
jgi:membrane protein DedA with SNARE-associated domain